MNWPKNTMIQLHQKAGPPNPKPKPNSWNMPVRIEMYEKPAAKEENDPSVRCSSCLYPKLARSWLSDTESERCMSPPPLVGRRNCPTARSAKSRRVCVWRYGSGE